MTPFLLCLIAVVVGGAVRFVFWWTRRVRERRVYRGVRPDDPLSQVVRDLAGRHQRGLRHSCLVIGIVRGGEVRIFREPAGDESLDGGTGGEAVFEIGSVTKLFTALALARCSAGWPRGVRSQLAEIAPGLAPPEVPLGGVSVVELGTHTSGVPRLPPGLKWWRNGIDDPYRDFDLDDLRRSVAATTLRRWRRGRYHYSNYGMALLGQACAAAWSLDFKALIMQEICQPLGLGQTTFLGPCGIVDPPGLVPGRSPSGRILGNWHFDAVAPAGGLVSSVRDLLAFAQLHLAPGSDWAESVGLCLRVHHQVRKRRALGLAWHLLRDPISEDDIWWHNGATGGYQSFLGLIHERQLGVVILTNSSLFGRGARELTPLGMRILRCVGRLDG